MIICITGPMASGKNYICSQLENENCVSIDLDKTVHAAIELCKDQIIKAFSADADKAGITLQNQDGSLNRRQLGQLLFSDKKLLTTQENIVYPKVIEITRKFIEENDDKTILINATVLFKTPELMELCNIVYFVTASKIKRLFRAIRRDKMPVSQILKRFKAQQTLLEEYKKTGKPVLLIKN